MTTETAFHFSHHELVDRIRSVYDSPRDQGPLEMIVQRPAVDARTKLDRGELIPGIGLDGDRWGKNRKPESRMAGTQLTIMNSRAAMAIAGSRDRWPLAGDQLYVDLDLSEANLPAGSRIQIGEVILEIAANPHNGCKKFSARFGAPALQFVNSEEGKELHLRGLYAIVVQQGKVRVGDMLTVVHRSEA